MTNSVRRRLLDDVEALADGVGPRHVGRPGTLVAAAEHVATRLREAGLAPEQVDFEVAGETCRNVWIDLGSQRPDAAMVVLVAHLDTVPGAPGADDNGSGVAAQLELARRLAASETTSRWPRTLRLAFTANEEPPHFLTGDMGSFRLARDLKAFGRRVDLMVAVESVGFFDDAPGSQEWPPLLGAGRGDVGDFLIFVTRLTGAAACRRAARAFARGTDLKTQWAAAPELVPGVAWSDHWAFWQHGYPGLMLTDTAPFRNPHYHRGSDRPETLDLERLAQVVDGLCALVRAEAGGA